MLQTLQVLSKKLNLVFENYTGRQPLAKEDRKIGKKNSTENGVNF